MKGCQGSKGGVLKGGGIAGVWAKREVEGREGEGNKSWKSSTNANLLVRVVEDLIGAAEGSDEQFWCKHAGSLRLVLCNRVKAVRGKDGRGSVQL